MLILLLFGLSTITACASGSNTSTETGGGDNSNNSNALTGVFLDSPVEGLNYQTATMSGITDKDGSFMYHDGETVTFFIGSLMLGVAPGKQIMTPIDIVPEAGVARRYCEKLMAHGLLCKETHENTIRFAPPLVITKEEIDWALERIETVLTA